MLEVDNPCQTCLERVYNFKISKKKLSNMIYFGSARPSLAVILFFPSFGAATQRIRLPGETFSGA